MNWKRWAESNEASRLNREKTSRAKTKSATATNTAKPRMFLTLCSCPNGTVRMTSAAAAGRNTIAVSNPEKPVTTALSQIHHDRS